MGLSISRIDISNNLIEISLATFPYSDHQSWLQKFAAHFEHSTEINITDFEYTGDTSGCSFIFSDTVFVLHISELVESVWIESSKESDELQIRLYNVLIKQFTSK